MIDNLKPEDVPGPHARWQEIEAFALTFDGHKVIGPRLGELATRHRKAGTVPEELAELRGCLFLQQRSWRHAQCVPDEAGLRHIRALVEGIRKKVG